MNPETCLVGKENSREAFVPVGPKDREAAHHLAAARYLGGELLVLMNYVHRPVGWRQRRGG